MKNIAVLFLMAFGFFSCQKDDFTITNLNNNKISILGHGGMGISHTYPMNSLESVLNCLNLGVDGTELDVQMTKDSVLVVFHDELLEHSTNTSGKIFNKTWEEISRATFRNPLYTKYRVVTLDDLFSKIQNISDYIFFLDCKDFNPDTSAQYLNTFNNSLIKIIDKYNLVNHTFIELKGREQIKSLRLTRPELKIFVYTSFNLGLELVNEFKLEGITISVDKISKDEVLKAHNIGAMIAVFNTHSKSRNMEAIEKNVDFIQTDNVKYLLKILN